jgi:hypothetical protein
MDMDVEWGLRQGTALSRPAQTMCSSSLSLCRVTNFRLPLPRVWAFILEGTLVREKERLCLGERTEKQECVQRARGMLGSRTRHLRGAHR